jgi:alpha-mannosidase
VHGERAAVTVEVWTVGGAPVPFAHAVQQAFRPFAVGEAWGRPFALLTLRFREALTVV